MGSSTRPTRKKTPRVTEAITFPVARPSAPYVLLVALLRRDRVVDVLLPVILRSRRSMSAECS
eukprot:CAMPEP_0185161838 /NCGR_PEP_ID=MMETSP1139-20130426/5562_1 /TAXON_ID=298111 /ORGANISM="Pavlova sp., Strain CCMP459" /LENGTH=62 /DNA_ID=CAMNT_0027727127 /DNA_START=725 /DNA_END=913 /DNA_ORIENTATION=-